MRFLSPADLRGLDARGLEELLECRAFVVAQGEGELRGLAAAAFLFADYAAMTRGGSVHLDCPEAWAAAVWRQGIRALLETDLWDEIIEGEDWFERWMQHRSTAALDSAAMLIRGRGGDPLERAEFARLFSAGEPAEGLAAFLEKRRPSFIVRNGRSP